LSDLHQFDLITLQWSEISHYVDGPALSSRFSFGFAAVRQSLFVFGGMTRTTGEKIGNRSSFVENSKCIIWSKTNFFDEI
jgi:hypothetical protein